MLFHRETSRIRQGDPATFDSLFTSYGPRIVGYLLRLTGNRSEAEDLAQETFLAAYRGCTGYQGKSDPLAWLLGIARRRWQEQYRQRKAISEPLSEDAITVSDHANQVATAATLSAALDRLPEDEREVLLLVAVQGLTYREAASVLGEPIGTVKWRVFEATKRLRTILTAADERYEAQYATRSSRK